MNIYKRIIFGVALVGLASCTDPGQKTGVGAATGGVIGAGLGAMIGNQTGDPGSGLLVGAVAGASTGAAVGNVLESHEKTIKSQDKAIEDQERRIRQYAREIDALKASSRDQVQFRDPVPAGRAAYGWGDSHAATSDNSNRAAMPSSDPGYDLSPSDLSPGAMPRNDVTETRIKEATIINPNSVNPRFSASQSVRTPAESGTAMDSMAVEPRVQQTITARNAPQQLQERTMIDVDVEPVRMADQGGNAALSAECREAHEEAQQARNASETADKLFHFRRALRLCPDDPQYHNSLGEIYVSLNRIADAEYEFKEALSLNPDFQLAQENLNTIKRSLY